MCVLHSGTIRGNTLVKVKQCLSIPLKNELAGGPGIWPNLIRRKYKMYTLNNSKRKIHRNSIKIKSCKIRLTIDSI